MSALETLRKDHQKILAQLKTAEKFVRHIEKNAHLDLDKLNIIVDSILAYFNGDLHAREKALFSSLESSGGSSERTQLFLELQAEHKACHELIKNVSRQIKQPISEMNLVKTCLVENLWTVIELRRQHIEKVQQRVYPLLDGYNPQAVQRRTRNLKTLQEAVNSM